MSAAPGQRSTRSKAIVLVTVMIILGATAIGVWSFTDSPLPTPATVEAERSVVVLGDSYASGEGLEPYQEGTDTAQNRCHRSDQAFPGLLDADDTLVVTNVACSGAELSALQQSFRTEPSQLSHVGSADIVILMLGGNDVDALSYVLEPDAIDEFTSRLDSLQADLVQAYQLVQAELPDDARLIVVGYPSPLTTPVPPGCFVSENQAQAITDGADQLNDVINDAAQQAGAEFVDIRPAFNGQGLCDAQPWINNFRFDNIPASLHPTAEGHVAIADAIRAQL